MSRISEYNGTDPNGTTSTMTSIHMTGAAYLSIVTIPSDGNYTIGFWIRAAGQYECNLSVEESMIKEFDVYRDWTRVEHTFEASANQQVALYLPAGDYYIWHAKLESGNKATDYSQSYQDMNDQIKSTEKTLRAELDMMAGKVILQIDNDGNIAAIELGAGEDEKGTVIQLTSDNIKFEAGELIELLTDGNLNLTGKNVSIVSDNFEVTADGTITSKAGTIGGLTITEDGISTENFEVDKEGNVTLKAGIIGDDLYITKEGIADADGEFKLKASIGLRISGVYYFNRQGQISCKELLTSGSFPKVTTEGFVVDTSGHGLKKDGTLSLGSGSRVGFFGTTPTSHKAVAKLTSTSTATTATIASKLNDVIGALDAYGLL